MQNIITRFPYVSFCFICFVGLLFGGCGVTQSSLLDNDARETIMHQSDTRVMKIVMNDKSIDYGSHISISSDWTEWNVAKVKRRDYGFSL